MNSFFSIIIPTLNEENFLPFLLNDLKNQKQKNFEVIVVDGASTDKTKAKAMEYEKNLGLTFFENKRCNVSIQRNFGAEHATGKYLIFLDADSRVSKSFTKKLEKAINRYKGLFFIPTLRTDDTNTETKFVIDIVNIFFELSQNIGRPFALGGGLIIEKNYFWTIGGFDNRLAFGEDYDLAHRSYHWGVRAKYLREVEVVYSLRRIRKEGKLVAYYKFFLSTVQYIIRGKTERKLFKYELGGHLYSENKEVRLFQDNVKLLINKAKKIFNNLLQEE